MSRNTKILLILGFTIGLLQVGSLGLMIFGVGPVLLAVAMKAALFACIGAFIWTAIRAVRQSPGWL